MELDLPSVLVPLAPGFEEIEATTIVDLLRRADVVVKTASLSTDSMVEGAHGMKVKADTTIDQVQKQPFDAVVLPGGMPGTTNLAKNHILKDILLSQEAEGRWVAAICAAPIVLGQHGLLQDKEATVYPGFEKKLTGANVVNDAVVEDGKIITSRGPGTAIPFALHLIKKLVSSEKALEVSQAILF